VEKTLENIAAKVAGSEPPAFIEPEVIAELAPL